MYVFVVDTSIDHSVQNNGKYYKVAYEQYEPLCQACWRVQRSTPLCKSRSLRYYCIRTNYSALVLSSGSFWWLSIGIHRNKRMIEIGLILYLSGSITLMLRICCNCIYYFIRNFWLIETSGRFISYNSNFTEQNRHSF